MRDLSSNITQPKQRKSRGFISTHAVNIFFLLSIAGLGLVYFFSVNELATQGLQIKKVNAQINELEAEHKKLELQNSSLQSVSSTQEASRQLNFVPVTNISYLKDDSFALK